MNHGNNYLPHQPGMPMQHAQHMPAHHPVHHQHQQHYQQHHQQRQHQMQDHQRQYHRDQQLIHDNLGQPPQPPTATQLIDNPRSSPKIQSQLLQIRPKYVEDQMKGKANPIPQKDMAKLRESYLKQRFALIVMQRQLHVANSRLNCALEGLRLAKESKPFHKFYVQAMDEKRHIKGVPKQKDESKEEEEAKKAKSAQTKMVTTKKGERQRPFKYSTRSKDEMTVISCAADYVVAGTATLAQAKDALREMGIFDFETSLSNKMYNHPDKKYYLKMRKERREEKKMENSKKSEARMQRKKNKQRETEMREQRKRQKRQKKSPVQHQPMIHDVQQPPHLAYGHPHLQQAVPQHLYAHHDMSLNRH